jgi:hypothetical protein
MTDHQSARPLCLNGTAVNLHQHLVIALGRVFSFVLSTGLMIHGLLYLLDVLTACAEGGELNISVLLIVQFSEPHGIEF